MNLSVKHLLKIAARGVAFAIRGALDTLGLGLWPQRRAPEFQMIPRLVGPPADNTSHYFEDQVSLASAPWQGAQIHPHGGQEIHAAERAVPFALPVLGHDP